MNTDRIKEITSESIITVTGEKIDVDRIILATGFDTSFKPKYPVIGKNGKSLSDVWSERPKGTL